MFVADFPPSPESTDNSKTSMSLNATQVVVINLLRDCIGSQKILEEKRRELESRKILDDDESFCLSEQVMRKNTVSTLL